MHKFQKQRGGVGSEPEANGREWSRVEREIGSAEATRSQMAGRKPHGGILFAAKRAGGTRTIRATATRTIRTTATPSRRRSCPLEMNFRARQLSAAVRARHEQSRRV